MTEKTRERCSKIIGELARLDTLINMWDNFMQYRCDDDSIIRIGNIMDDTWICIPGSVASKALYDSCMIQYAQRRKNELYKEYNALIVYNHSTDTKEV